MKIIQIIISFQVKKLISIFKIIPGKDEQMNSPYLQIVSVSQKWTNDLKKFVFLYYQNPYICIDSCMEAAIYSMVKSRVVLSPSVGKPKKIAGEGQLENGKLCQILFTNKSISIKPNLLAEILSNLEEMQRTMVICARTEEVLAVDEYLQKAGKKTIAAHGDMNFMELDELKLYWNKSISGLYPVLICTDEVLPDLQIGNVDHMINFSLPPVSKRQFHYRFTTIMDNLIMVHIQKLFLQRLGNYL